MSHVVETCCGRLWDSLLLRGDFRNLNTSFEFLKRQFCAEWYIHQWNQLHLSLTIQTELYYKLGRLSSRILTLGKAYGVSKTGLRVVSQAEDIIWQEY